MQNEFFKTVDLSTLKLQQRLKLAQDPNTSPELLQELSIDKYATVRNGVAENPNCSASILEVLVNDKDNDVRRNVGYNPNATADILDKIAIDNDPCVRASAAVHPNTSIITIEKLADDVDSLVSKNARSHNKFKNIVYRIIKFGHSDHGFWNEPEWYSHYDGAITSYNNACSDSSIAGVVFFMVDHEEHTIIKSHNMDNYDLIYNFTYKVVKAS